jgi:phage FluMu gp28-like protein
MLRLVVKSRQIGFSWIIAAEGLHTIEFNVAKKVNYVSINQKEASDKIVYAKQFFYSIPAEIGLRAPIYTSSTFEFSLHEQPDTSYMVSQPASSAIRGGEKDIYFDEFAHVRDAGVLYDAAVPATTRGNSRFTVISTPLGQSGKFFDIAKDRGRFPGYTIHIVPWYECSIMSVDVVESTAIGADYSTEDRVRKWGTPKIKEIFANFDLESFQQEYECSFADESVSFYPWDLIISGVDDSLNDNEVGEGSDYNIGIDIAKKIDKTVITVSKQDADTGVSTVYKTYESQEKYSDQVKQMDDLIDKIRPKRVSIDATGVGAVISEGLKTKYGSIIEEITFSQENKEAWSTKFKGDLQSRRVSFPRIRSLLNETHNIERIKSEAGNYLFRAKNRGHDDYFWSMMLSLYGNDRQPSNIGFMW